MNSNYLKIFVFMTLLNCNTIQRGSDQINIADLAYRGDIYGISRALSYGGYINERDSFMRKYTALMVACREGDLKLAEFLIEKGADINARTPDGHTALMFASYNRYPDIVRLLIKRGAKINLKSTQGHTALSEVLESDKKIIIELLQNAGAEEEK